MLINECFISHGGRIVRHTVTCNHCGYFYDIYIYIDTNYYVTVVGYIPPKIYEKPQFYCYINKIIIR